MARVETIDASASSKKNTSTNNNANTSAYDVNNVTQEHWYSNGDGTYQQTDPNRGRTRTLVPDPNGTVTLIDTNKGRSMTASPVSQLAETPSYDYSGYSAPSYEAPSEGGGYDYMSFFNQLMDSLNANYNNLYNMLQQNLADSKASLNANNEESLRQAYINYMMNKRNMQRDLDENGINGGAAETTLARMYNDYGTNRRLINAQTEEQLRQLMQSHNSNMASVAQNQANNQLSAQLALAQMMK